MFVCHHNGLRRCLENKEARSIQVHKPAGSVTVLLIIQKFNDTIHLWQFRPVSRLKQKHEKLLFQMVSCDSKLHGPISAYKLLRQLIQKVLLLQKCLLRCYLRQYSECLTHFAWLLKNVQLLVVLSLACGSAVLCSGAQKSLVNISEVVALIVTFRRFILRCQLIYKVVK